ncbi:MAG: lipocalin-like domain-containing protein [Pseudomonadota bacterium]
MSQISATERRFLGFWRLADWSAKDLASGQTRAPMEGRAVGHLHYTSDGRVSATLMHEARAPLTLDRLAVASLRQQVLNGGATDLDAPELEGVMRYFMAGTGYVNYSGTFSVDDNHVAHRVETSFTPQWVGRTLRRRWTFSESERMLTLTAASRQSADALVWRRD